MESMELDLRPRDALGEMSNISMGSSATALSALLMNRRVEITTPQVEVIRRSRLMWRVSRFLKNFLHHLKRIWLRLHSNSRLAILLIPVWFSCIPQSWQSNWWTIFAKDKKKGVISRRETAPFWFARHGRALTGESPEHAQATRKCIAEQQGCLS